MYALNTGAQAGYIQAVKAGELPPNAMLEWITTPDERLCSECAPMNGETKPIGANTTFSNGSVGPPLHPHCRCTLGIVLVPQEEGPQGGPGDSETEADGELADGETDGEMDGAE